MRVERLESDCLFVGVTTTDPCVGCVAPEVVLEDLEDIQ